MEKALLQVIPGKEITMLKEVIVLLSEKCNGWPGGHLWLTALQLADDDVFINPLSPNGDQHQFSPNHIHRLSRD